jgi:predicted metal-binding protein
MYIKIVNVQGHVNTTWCFLLTDSKCKYIKINATLNKVTKDFKTDIGLKYTQNNVNTIKV